MVSYFSVFKCKTERESEQRMRLSDGVTAGNNYFLQKNFGTDCSDSEVFLPDLKI